MERVLIIGCSGSGKSTLAKIWGQRKGLPVVHLDHLLWMPGWVQREAKDFDVLLQKELEKDRWVMDGNNNRTVAHRIQYADTVVFMDFNRWLCTYRALKRWLRREGYQAEGYPQKVDLEFLKYILWDYHGKDRSQVLQLKRQYEGKLNWVTLKSSKDVERWVSSNGCFLCYDYPLTLAKARRISAKARRISAKPTQPSSLRERGTTR
jgi:adenylate kinase family enzyme